MLKKVLLFLISFFLLTQVLDTYGNADIQTEKNTPAGSVVPRTMGSRWKAPVQEEIASKLSWGYNKFISNTYEALRKAHPDYIKRNEISKDTSGRFSIWKYEFTPKHYTQTILLTAGMHGEEYEGYWGLYSFFKILCDDYDKYEQFDYIRNNVRVVVIPAVNPYGVDRKERYDVNRADCNKNFGIFWGLDGYEFEGSAAFSEKESHAVKTVCDEYNDNFSFYIDLHTDPYDPYFGAYATIDNDSPNHLLVEGLVKEEKAVWKEEYGKSIPGLVEERPRCSAIKYLNKVRSIPSALVEFGIAQLGPRGSAMEMTAALEWYANCIIRHIEAGFGKETGMDPSWKKYLDSISADPLKTKGFTEAYRTGISPENLIAWYEGADILNRSRPKSWYDKSGFRHNASMFHFGYSATSGADGKGNIAFDGKDDRIEIPISVKDFTFQWEIELYDNGKQGRILSANNDSFRIYMKKTEKAFAKVSTGKYLLLCYSYPFGKEIVLTLKRSGDMLTLYIDGGCVSSCNTASEILSRICIGNNPASAFGLHGKLSSFLAYDRALTEKEIYRNSKAAAQIP